jgi:hypothetical protein
VLGRFAQADTIVPNPTDAKAFDRYAYVYNNPVRYNDPSGHEPGCFNNGGLFIGNLSQAECWANNGEVDYGYDTDNIDSLASYGVSVSGFTREQMDEILKAVQDTANALFAITGNFTPQQLFRLLFGEFSIIKGIYEEKDEEGNVILSIDKGCYTSGTIYCASWYKGELYENILHELGHKYDQVTGRIVDGGSEALGYASITYVDEITGKKIVATGNGYGPGGTWGRGFDGYQSKIHPFIQNPAKTSGEEWADMFANWVNGTFTDSNAGDARNEWMRNQLQIDIQKKIGQGGKR